MKYIKILRTNLNQTANPLNFSCFKIRVTFEIYRALARVNTPILFAPAVHSTLENSLTVDPVVTTSPRDFIKKLHDLLVGKTEGYYDESQLGLMF